MRFSRHSITRSIIAVVVSGCIGGQGSGMVGIAGNGGGTNKPPASLPFFVQPNSANVGRIISPPVQVAAFDSLGSLDSAFTGSITISLASNPTGATLSGTTVVRPVNGIASFSNLAIDKAGSYTLQASTSGVAPVVSNGFTINTPNAP